MISPLKGDYNRGNVGGKGVRHWGEKVRIDREGEEETERKVFGQ